MSWPGVGVAFPALGTDYEFVRLLGRGGSGWVVLARHRQLQRLEAVKIIRGGSRQLPSVRRLEREGRVLAGLDHPGIVTVYRLLTSASSLALAMEYLPGGDLQQAMDAGRLGGAERVGILHQVAAALTAAGAVGVVHRDVKPSNVLLDGTGRAVLADFGLARLPVDSAAFRTMTGAATGTPLFMAPEQITDPDADSPAIDAYAFGVLAYRLLVGAWPYPAGNVVEVLQAHRSRPATPPWVHLPALPRAAGQALLDALAKDPAERLRPDALVGGLAGYSAGTWDTLLGNGSDVGGSVTVVAGSTGPQTAGSAGARADGAVTGAEIAVTGAEIASTGAENAVTGAEIASTGAEIAVPGASVAGVEIAAAGAETDREGEDPLLAADGSTVALEWVHPPVYRIRRRVSPRLLAGVLGLLVGLLLVVVIYLAVVVT